MSTVNIDAKLWKAIKKLLTLLNDDDQEDCLYEPLLIARDKVNELLKETKQEKV